MTRITICLTGLEKTSLCTLTEMEFREPCAQAFLITHQELDRRGFLTKIRDECKAIYANITKIESREMVPVPGCPNIVVDYRRVINLEHLSETNFILEGLQKRNNARKLLNGISPEIKRRIRIEPIHDEPKYHIPITTLVKAHVTPEKNKSLFLQILNSLFVFFPQIIGRAILDVFGRDKAANSTAVLLGYILIVVAVQVIRGTLDMNLMIQKFMNIWRFFIPVV